MKNTHLVSLLELEVETGRHYREIKKSLQSIPHVDGPKNSMLYDCRLAYKAVYNNPDQLTLSEVQLERQKAETRLAKAKADKIEIEVGKAKGELLPAKDVEMAWGKQIETFRSKLLNMPQKLDSILGHLGNRGEIESVTRDLIYEAMEELSHEPLHFDEANPSHPDSCSSSEINDE